MAGRFIVVAFYRLAAIAPALRSVSWRDLLHARRDRSMAGRAGLVTFAMQR